MIEKSDEWKKQRHIELNECLKQFVLNAHKTMDRVIESEQINNDSFIAGDSTALAYTVMILMGSKDYRPTRNQVKWSGEIALLKKVI